MTIKRLILILLTILTIGIVFNSLGESFDRPQIQSRLELYQSNLLLHASEIKPDNLALGDGVVNEDIQNAKKAILGSDPYLTAQKQYREALKVARTTRTNFEAQLAKISANNDTESVASAEELASEREQLEKAIAETNNFIDELDLKLGILAAERGETKEALASWDSLIDRHSEEKTPKEIDRTASVLKNLWGDPPKILADAESLIESDLNGWFRYRSLKQLYRLQNRQADLANLAAAEQALATQAIVKLALIGGIPVIGGIIGIGILIFSFVELLLKRDRSLLATNSGVTWETPWDAEIVWQVIIVGFFFIGQVLLPLLFQLSGFTQIDLSLRFKAVYVLVSYLLMAFAGLSVMYFSIKSFFPLAKDWFRSQLLSNWIFWSIGGYLVAIPLVVLVSLINQQLWNGQGGSNPLLYLALQANDRVVLGIFFFTASIAAPIFEEIIFRGFLLPSLTRYFPVWGSIVVSSLIFAIAHLSLSEVLPLTTLGIILGFIYTRSRNLFAPMFLHSLWNSGTLLSLFVLGSGVS
jgi:hypothetical protein